MAAQHHMFACLPKCLCSNMHWLTLVSTSIEGMSRKPRLEAVVVVFSLTAVTDPGDAQSSGVGAFSGANFACSSRPQWSIQVLNIAACPTRPTSD